MYGEPTLCLPKLTAVLAMAGSTPYYIHKNKAGGPGAHQEMLTVSADSKDPRAGPSSRNTWPTPWAVHKHPGYPGLQSHSKKGPEAFHTTEFSRGCSLFSLWTSCCPWARTVQILLGRALLQQEVPFQEDRAAGLGHKGVLLGATLQLPCSKTCEFSTQRPLDVCIHSPDSDSSQESALPTSRTTQFWAGGIKPPATLSILIPQHFPDSPLTTYTDTQGHPANASSIPLSVSVRFSVPPTATLYL